MANFSDASQLLQSGNIHLLKFLQIIQSTFLFIIPPIVFTFFVSEKPQDWLHIKKTFSSQTLILIILLMLAMFPVTNFLAEINRLIQFPDFLKDVYNWMVSKEDEMNTITEQFLRVDSVGEFLLNFLMIAIIPAVGEELLFRGTIQKIFSGWTKNQHWGVVIAAFLFSAVHIQFMTFMPRFFLGIIFGYLLVWSQSIWVPILAHFLNNGMAVVMSYLTQNQNLNQDVENIGQSNNFFWLSLFNILFVGIILFFIYKIETKTKKLKNESQSIN